MKVGSLVECIDGKFEAKLIDLIPNRPERGKVYTIRQIKQYTNSKVGLLLEEIVNDPLILPNLDGLFEPTFDINRFRELPETNIDELIEVLEVENIK